MKRRTGLAFAPGVCSSAFTVFAALGASLALAEADDPPPASPPAAEQHESTAPGSPGPDNVQFSTGAKWQRAGYNLEEIVYTVTITSHDTRVLRCRTRMQGGYFENGKKQTISDMQVSTVFPDTQVQVGTWTGLDEKLGVTYTVECRVLQ